MQGHKKILMLLLGLALTLAACLNPGQPKNKVEYFTLEYVPPLVGTHRPLPHVIRVQQFSVSPHYNSNRIIYRDKSYKRQAYTYYKWQANPAKLATYFLSRDLRESGLFKAVLPADSRFAPAFALEGTVNDFLEKDGESTWEAVLSVSIAFLDEKEPDISQKIIFQKTYHASKPCRQKNPRALAAAMSSAMSVISSELTTDIYNHLAARKADR
jgi:cholesterol transport system auxiliary component